MSVRDIRQGIDAIRNGNVQEGARLIKVGLKDEDISPQVRAVALSWLAETQDSVERKIDYYQQAAQADPGNQDVAERLSYYLSQQLPARQDDESQRLRGYPEETQPSQSQQTTQPSQPWSMSPQQQPQQPPPQSPQQGWPDPGTPYSQPAQPVQSGWSNPSDDTGSQSMTLSQAQRTVGIQGGPNGRGTGIFVTRDGLIATTRYVAGGNTQLVVELQDGRQIPADVVRSFPQVDLALVKAPLNVPTLLNVAQTQHVPDNAPILAVSHPGDGLRGSRRATRHQTDPHWFPTTINYLLDAGGNPVFTLNDNLLTGLLTRNLSRASGYYYALHISKIYQCVQQYLQEAQNTFVQTIYCTACGSLSRAPAQNAYYCEFCGSTHDYALGMSRYPQEHLLRFYGEGTQPACPNCDSRAGFYDGQCLRCGYYL
jgi:hypothetical protein